MTRFVSGIAALGLQRNGVDVLPMRARAALPARFAVRGAGTAWAGDDAPNATDRSPGERGRASLAEFDPDRRGGSAPPATDSDARDHRDGPPFAATPPAAPAGRGPSSAPIRRAAVLEAGRVPGNPPGERAGAAPATVTEHPAPTQGLRSPALSTGAWSMRPREPDPVPATPFGPRRLVVDAAARTASHAPLREATLAERHSARSDERPVIHVTIDRIDVRAPAAAARPAPARARAQPQPSVSLADYLRGKGRTGSSS